MLLFGVVGKCGRLGERHVAVLAHKGALSCVQPLMIFQRGICSKLGPALFTGERLLIEMLGPFVVLQT